MVSKQAVAILKKIVEKHKHEIKLPKMGRWKTMSDNDLWAAIVIQVVVVGGSAPHVAVKEQLNSQENWYAQLLELSDRRRKSCGIQLPDDLATNKNTYKELESELIEKVCRPLQIPGSLLDRILYQKHKEIVLAFSHLSN